MKNEIENIIIAKKYTELNPAELAEIQEYISGESEYNDVRAMLLSLEDADDYIDKTEPPSAIKSQLLEVFNKKYKSQRKTINLKWLSIAAGVVVIAATTIWMINYNTSSGNPETVQAPPTPKEDKQIQPADNTTPAHQPLAEVEKKQAILDKQETRGSELHIAEKQSPIVAKGLSMAENEDLMNITTTIF